MAPELLILVVFGGASVLCLLTVALCTSWVLRAYRSGPGVEAKLAAMEDRLEAGIQSAGNIARGRERRARGQGVAGAGADLPQPEGLLPGLPFQAGSPAGPVAPGGNGSPDSIKSRLRRLAFTGRR
jgi:hypothetical protein